MSCSAVNCRNRKSEKPELYFFRFPLDQELRRKWVVAMRREKMKGEDKPWEPSKHTRLCSLHFKPEDIDHTRIYRKLNRNAIPCIFHWPDKNQKPKEPSISQELPPKVLFNVVPKNRQPRYQKKVIQNELEEPDVHLDLNSMPLWERLSELEKVIDSIQAPRDQHSDLPKVVKNTRVRQRRSMNQKEKIIENYLPQCELTDLKEEIEDAQPLNQLIDVKIEDVDMPQDHYADLKEEINDALQHNQLSDVKEEIVEDVHMLQNQLTDVKEEVIEDIYLPRDQLIDVKEEVIEDVHVPQNQLTDAEEVIKDVYMPQNQLTDLKEEIIEDICVPQNQLTDVEEIIEDVYMPQNQVTHIQEVIEDVYLPQNQVTDVQEVIEDVYLPQNQVTDVQEVIEDVYGPQNQVTHIQEVIEDVYLPQNQVTDVQEVIEDVYLLQNGRSDTTEEIIVDLHMPQDERISKLKAQCEKGGKKKKDLLQLKNDQVAWLKNLVNKNSENTLRHSQKLKRLNSSKTYFQRKLSAMNSLLEELNSLE